MIAGTSLSLVVGAACGQREESATTPTSTPVTVASTTTLEPVQPAPETTTPDKTIVATATTESGSNDAEVFVLDGVVLQLAAGTRFTLLEPTRTITMPNGRSIEQRRYRHTFGNGTGGETAAIAVQPEDDPYLQDILALPGLDDGTAETITEGDDRYFARYKRVGDRIVQVAFTETSPESADQLMAAIGETK